MSMRRSPRTINRSVTQSQTKPTDKKETNMTTAAVDEKTNESPPVGESVEATVNDQPVVDTTKPYDGPDIVASTMFPMIQQVMSDYSTLNSKLLAAEGNQEKAIEDFIENSEDPLAVRLRKAIEEATSKLRRLAEKSVVTEEVPEETKDKWRAQLDEWKNRIKAAKSTIKTLSESTSSDPDGILAYLAAMPDPTASNRGRKPGTAGSSLPRTSCTVTVVGGDLKETTFDTMSAAAIKLNVELEDLQKAFAAAASVEHKDISAIKHEVKFSFQPNENGTIYNITTRPKERKPRGSSDETKKSETKTEETANA